MEAIRATEGATTDALLVKSDSPIRTIADLKGKRIATGRGSIGHYLLVRVLERAGLRPDDIKLVFLNPGDSKAAFTAGSVDAWATWGVYVALARLQDHVRVLADGRGLLSGLAFEAATDSAIAGKRPQLNDFLARLARAQRWEASHQAEYADVLAKETGVPADVALYTVERVRGGPVPIDATVLADERETLDHYVRGGVITSAPNIEGAFDASFNGALNAGGSGP